MKIKAVEIVFVEAMDAEHSGIGKPVPAHVKLRFRDKEGRRNAILLDLSENQMRYIFPESKSDTGDRGSGLTAAQVQEFVEWCRTEATAMDGSSKMVSGSALLAKLREMVPEDEE